MVPAWLRRKKPSGNALLVYVNLAAFGAWNPETGAYEECRPALASLADECGLSPATTKRALAELYGLGAVERRAVWGAEDNRRLPSIYRVIFGAVVEPSEVPAETPGSPVSQHPSSPVSQGADLHKLTHEPDPQLTREPPPSSPVSQNQEPSTKNKINTRDARARAREAQPALLAEIVDSPPRDVVWSGHTSLEEYQRRVAEAVEMIMQGWRSWADQRGVTIARDTEANAQRQVHQIVADAARRPGDLTPTMRNVWRGLVAWSAESYPAWRIPDFVRKASAAGLTPAERGAPSKGERQRANIAEALAEANARFRSRPAIGGAW